MALTLYQQFCQNIQELNPYFPKDIRSSKVAVACSGGIDSMVLCDCVLSLWSNTDVAVLIVDHGLRPDSNLQAQQVARYWLERGANASVLTLPPYVQGNKMAWARTERYAALDAWCAQNSFPLLMLGHHADDVAENFLIRLHRKAGIYGLAMMQSSFYLSHVQVLRPLLCCFKEQIYLHQKDQKLPIAYDSSNDDLVFQRIRIRKQLKHPIYWNKQFLFSISATLAKITANIEEEINPILAQVHIQDQTIYIDSSYFFQQHPALQRIVIRRMIAHLTQSYPPKEKQIQAALQQLRNQKKCSIGRTICSIKRNKLWLTLAHPMP